MRTIRPFALLAVSLFLANLAGYGAPPPTPDVELINDSGEMLQPSSTLEFRFAQPIVDREQISGAAAQSPIAFQPDLPGRFTWLSRRSGVFAPDNIPPLGVNYQVSVRRGLKAADGKPVGEKFRAILRTPPFGTIAVHNGAGDDEDIDPRPKVKISFNSEIVEQGAAAAFKFVNDKGAKIPAVVRYLTSEDESEESSDDERDWAARWQEAKTPETPETKPDKAKRTFYNKIMVTPETILTAGRTWRLEMAPGLRSRAGNYRTAKPQVIQLGLVKPFTLKAISTANYLNAGRSVSLEFTQEVAPDVSAETGVKFFHIAPAVTNLRLEEENAGVVLYGDFKRGQKYRLELDRAVIAKNGLSFEGDRARTFEFAPARPRIYLPEITTHQISGGNRKFEVHSANMKTLHVIARRVAPDDVARAVAAFSLYNQSSNDDESEPGEFYKKLPDDAINGEVISDEKIDLSASEIDARQDTLLDWDKIAGPKKAGAIFLTVEGEPRREAPGKPTGGQALVQLTDLGILWKRVGNELRVTIFSHMTGKPVAGAQVKMLDPDFNEMQTAQTGANGAITLPVTAEPGWLIARLGEDAHTLRIGKSGMELPLWSRNVSIFYRDWTQHALNRVHLRGFLFTDRPLYQPGEEMKVKGIMREMREGKLSPMKNRPGKITLRDDRGDRVDDVDVTTNDTGSFDAALKVGAVAGKRTVSFRPEHVGDDETFEGESVTFDVAPYQPNAFELNVAIPKRFGAAEPFRAAVSAKYFFGAAITKSQARWTLRDTREPFRPDGFDDFQFGRIEQEEENALTLRGEGELSGTQEFVIDPRLPVPVGVPRTGVLTVEVTDANQQTVSDTQRVARDASEFYLGMSMPERSVIVAGEEASARVVAVQSNGQPLDKPVKINAELVRMRHETVRMQGAGKAITFKTETREEKVAESAGETIVPKKLGDFWDVSEGAGVKFKIPAGGEYRIRATAKDSSGHEAIAEIEIFGSGRDKLAWSFRNASQVDLLPDKSEYQPGEKARILVKTPISGKAMVSIEREDSVLRTMEVDLQGNAPSFEVPISAGDSPNVCVSAVLIRGAEASTRKYKTPDYRFGICNLRVANPASRMQITVAPAKAEVQPGDEVETEVTVRDGQGAVVNNAEVTFFAVDDGVLALTGYTRPAPGEVFYRPLSLSTRMGLSLYELMAEDPSDLTFENKGYLIGGGGAEGPGTKLRHDFPGTACWMPALRTGRDGKVKARFKAPDALTRYRLVAVAHAGDMFGSNESAFAIRKPLVVMPALGLFANVGDQLNARAVIRNDSGADGVVDLSLKLDETAESSAPTSAKVEIKNGDARTVDFPVKLKATGRAEWKWSAHLQANGKTFDDQVASPLEVGSSMLVLHEIYSTDAREASNDILAGVNPQILEGIGRVNLTVANTRLASLRGSVNHLREYPYGCAEQTVSSLIPWIVLPDLRPVLPELTADDEKKAIAKGLEKIASMQTASGGLAFWPGGRKAELFPSAYAGIALGLLDRQGVDVKDRQEKLLKYLSGELRGMNQLRDESLLGDRVLAVVALAISGKPEPAYQEELYRRRAELTRESRALLALAILESKAPTTTIEELLDPRIPAPETFSWYSGAARETAAQLMVWSQYKPTAPEVSRLTNELLQFRKGGRWHTTQDNAWALMALARYFKNVEGGGKPARGSIAFNKITKPFDVTNERPSATEKFDFDEKNKLAALRVENPQKAIVFADADFKAHPPLGDQPRQDRGFAVSRSYRKIGDDGALIEPANLKVGDRILVTLRIEMSRPARFVAIDDPFPSIFEAVNPAFVSRASGEGSEALAAESYSDYREMRADRVLIFCDSMPTGAYTYRYLARVRSAGTAMAGSTKAEEMYRPERFGLSETMRVSSKAAEEK